MNAADTARGKEANARHTGTQHGAGHRGCSQLARCQSDRQVATAHLLYMLGRSQARNLVKSQAYMNLAFAYADGCRNGSLVTDGRFHGLCYLDVPGVWQAMSYGRRFQGDNRTLCL